MKTRSPNIPSIDWSEFHIWSPSGVDKKLKGDLLFQKNSKSNKANSLISCNSCAKKAIHVRIPSDLLKPKTKVKIPDKPMEHHHDIHRHGLVREAYSHLAAGALGGSTATYTTHWLDTVKVKMQTQPGLYPSGRSCLIQSFRSDGIKGLYQGALPAVMGQACKTAIVFMSYGVCEEMVRRMTNCERTEDMTLWHHASSGAMTGIVASFVLCPLELLKCRLQALAQVTDQLKRSEEQKIFRSMTSLRMVRHILKKKKVPTATLR